MLPTYRKYWGDEEIEKREDYQVSLVLVHSFMAQGSPKRIR